MRVPTRKVYRAFPELDEFNDEQCRRLMRRVKLHHRAQGNIVVGVLLSVVVGLVVGLVAGVWITANLLPPIDPKHDVLAILPVLLGATVTPAVLGLAARDAVLRRHLVKAIKIRLERVRCPGCKYILIGQRAEAGVVACPECGGRVALRSLGLTEQDLIPPSDQSDPLDRV